jgi:lysine-specific demethylase 3
MKCETSRSTTKKRKPDPAGVESTRVHNGLAQNEATDHSFVSSDGISIPSVKSDKIDTLDVRAQDVGAESKIKYARYLLHYLMPCLRELNEDQMVERQAEAKSQGKLDSSEHVDNEKSCDLQLILSTCSIFTQAGLELSEMNVEQADCRNDERVFWY